MEEVAEDNIFIQLRTEIILTKAIWDLNRGIESTTWLEGTQLSIEICTNNLIMKTIKNILVPMITILTTKKKLTTMIMKKQRSNKVNFTLKIKRQMIRQEINLKKLIGVNLRISLIQQSGISMSNIPISMSCFGTIIPNTFWKSS